MGTRAIEWVPDTQQWSCAGFSWLMATILGAIEGTRRGELWDGHHFITWCLGAECSSVSDTLMTLVTLLDPCMSLGVTLITQGKLEPLTGACSPVTSSQSSSFSWHTQLLN